MLYPIHGQINIQLDIGNNFIFINASYTITQCYETVFILKPYTSVRVEWTHTALLSSNCQTDTT